MSRAALHLTLRLLALLSLLLGSGSVALAQPIVNRATLDLRLGGVERSIASNQVVAERISAPTPAVATILRAADGGTGIETSGGQCRTPGGSFTTLSAAGPGGSTQTLALDAPVVRAGDTLVITLRDGNRNLDSAVRDTIDLTVISSAGDEEYLRLLETGADTGLFAATIATVAVPPAPTRFDCRLSVTSGVSLTVRYTDIYYPSDVTSDATIVDPVEFVFDSQTGEPINGASVTLVSMATGQPALVYGDDGKSAFPATLVSGGSATDASGRTYNFPDGGFRFPVVAPGDYRFVVTPPQGYSAPSQVAIADLVRLLNPAGDPYTIDPEGSFLKVFRVDGPVLFRIDLPLDPQRLPLLVRKTASVEEATPGDFIHYRLTVENRNGQAAVDATALLDTMSGGLRYQPGSLRVNGAKVADPAIAGSGANLRIELGTVAAGAIIEVGYVVQVTPAARIGDAVNLVQAVAGNLPASNDARASVRIKPLLMSDAATLIGRVFDGGCDVPEGRKPGIAGIRLLMEDGTFTVSDKDGLFHFEGVRPGVHVVQLDRASLPEGYEVKRCIDNSRHAGRDFSQFVDVRGGALWRVNFHVARKDGAVSAATAGKALPVLADPRAPLAQPDARPTDWFAGQQPGNAILFPAADHNPSSPALRMVVKHVAGSTVRLTVNGKPVPAVAFDGTDENGARDLLVSKWRGLPLVEGENAYTAEVVDAAGKRLALLGGTVHYANAVARAELVASRSRLVADGRTRPVVAIRLLDRFGKPVRQGVTGSYRLSAPYRAAADLDLRQARQLTGSGSSEQTYRVAGDDGIALIELQPTTQAGGIELGFDHQVDRRRVSEVVRGWMQPGDQPWVVVGFAAGTLGHEVLTNHVERLESATGKTGLRDGQVSFFAKGRILGKWLMTMAFDSDKQTGRAARRPLGGTIDPQRYYDIYGDGTEQAYDAASTGKLYLRLERKNFLALFGDYETGLTESQLARYSRSFTGGKAEYRDGTLAVKAFAAETGFRYARDEIQGSGLSGPYRLSRTDLILNSDKVRIETRDRYRSERIVTSRSLVRHVDYDIDYAAGTLRFRQPVLSRDSDFNPNFIVAEYETEGAAQKALNAGGRAAVRLLGGQVEAGASLIHEEELSATTNLAGADLKVKLGQATELRVEAAASRTDAGGERRTGAAYLAEAEHRGSNLDLLAYFRHQDADFGLGQQNGAEAGSRKYGVDGRVRVGDGFSFSGAAWREEREAGGSTRQALRSLAEYQAGDTALRAGFQAAHDRIGGKSASSSQLLLGVGQSFLDDRLRIDADAAIALRTPESLDFPDRYRLGLSYALNSDVRVVAAHELSKGELVDTAMTSLGLELSPWRGGRVSSTVNQQSMGEQGERTYALYGLAQGFQLNDRWGIDLTVDGSRTLSGGFTARDVLNPAQPVANGGYVDAGRTLSEDFWAVTAGATYRSPVLSWTGRLELRDGALDDRFGLVTALLHQTRSGISYAASAQLFRTRQANGTAATLGLANASLAWRPLGSRWAVLDKLELKWDSIENGLGTTDGLLGADGLGVIGNARSRRIVNNLAVNLVGDTDGKRDLKAGETAYEKSQLSLYYGSKYVLDSFGRDDFGGYTHMLGLEGRWDIRPRFDIGLNLAARHSLTSGTINYLIGPSVGIAPLANLWVSVGYNVTGFNDRDFDDARYTRDGFYVKLRFKFDQDTPAALFGRASQK